MKNIKKLDLKSIKNMNYTDFISFINEENRPSGGKKTIREIAINSFVTKNSKVLEIGSTNGFSSLEINKLTNCRVVGVDINKNSIKNANAKIKKNNLDSNRIEFRFGNAEELEFDDEEFDMIISGNALSFISNKDKALNEMLRVLKPNGFIAIVPIWYREKPDLTIVNKVNEILGFKIKCTYEDDWINFNKPNLELYYKNDYEFIIPTEDQIKHYVNEMLKFKENINIMSLEAIEYVKERWENIISVFSQNLSMTNYSVILLRKNVSEEESEIFLTMEKQNE